ncbi:MAG: nucleotidyltransferase family protein [Gammaproteobacteria bacterium]|nr:nucleotidyltransferase family protein [Gammaproteobacteria bacterium]MDP2349452.1 nucleotidyltransferase family protein [Gammaproteobacteria bacterium]
MKETTGTVGALLLAAGFSRRFGDVKLRARLHNGSTVFSQTLARLAAATPNILVVTRDDLPDVTLTVEQLGSTTVRAVVCPDSHLGMGHTLAFGMNRIPNWDACLVCLGDMPFISTATYRQLLDALRSDAITLPRIEGQIGNPAGFGSDFYPALRKVLGDTGGREVVQANRERIQYITVPDSAVLQDIDTPEDLARLQ